MQWDLDDTGYKLQNATHSKIWVRVSFRHKAGQSTKKLQIILQENIPPYIVFAYRRTCVAVSGRNTILGIVS